MDQSMYPKQLGKLASIAPIRDAAHPHSAVLVQHLYAKDSAAAVRNRSTDPTTPSCSALISCFPSSFERIRAS